MRITTSVYIQIKETLGAFPPECGGILGSRSGIVTHFHFDRRGTADSYTPDTKQLENVILEWSRYDISFAGFIHSHPKHNPILSRNDRAYIHNIFAANHVKNTNQPLYFPIVIPQEDSTPFDFICYRAEMINYKPVISREALYLLM